MNKKPVVMTGKLQKLVKKRKTEPVIIKAGSIKNKQRGHSGSIEDYYPSYAE